MGNVSACCSVADSGGKEVIHANGEQGGLPEVIIDTSATPVDPAAASLQKFDLNVFQQRLEQSIDITVVIADGTRLPCKLRWASSEKSLILTCDVNNNIHVRRMELDELVAVIYGKKELTRVATRANIVDDPTCVALHLASNTCIPICMQSVEDRQCFVDFMKQLKARTRNLDLISRSGKKAVYSIIGIMDRICSYCQSVLNFDKPNDLACTCSPKNSSPTINEQKPQPFLDQDTEENEKFSNGAGILFNDDETALSALDPDNHGMGDFTEAWLDESGGQEVINNLTEDLVAAHNSVEPSVVNRLALVGMDIIPSEHEQSDVQESYADVSTCADSEFLKSPESAQPPILQRMNAMGPAEFSELLGNSESATVESSHHASQRATRDIVHREVGVYPTTTNNRGTTASHLIVPSAPSDDATAEMKSVLTETISKQLPSQGSRVANPSGSQRERSRLATPPVINQRRNRVLATPRCTVPCPTECSSIGAGARMDEVNYIPSSQRSWSNIFNDVKSPPNPPYLNSRSTNDTLDGTIEEQVPAPRSVIDENKSETSHSHFVSYRSF